MSVLINWVLGCGAVSLCIIASVSAIGLALTPMIRNQRSRRFFVLIAIATTLISNFVQGVTNYYSGQLLLTLPLKVIDAQESRRTLIPTTLEKSKIRDAAFLVLNGMGYWFRSYEEDSNGNVMLYYATSELKPTDGVVCIPNYDVPGIVNGNQEDAGKRLKAYVFDVLGYKMPDKDTMANHGRFCEYVGLVMEAISQEYTAWEFRDGMFNLNVYFYDSWRQVDFDIKKCRLLRGLTRIEMTREIARVLSIHGLNPNGFFNQGE